MRAPAVFLVIAGLGLAAVACEELNRPAYVPQTSPRVNCFSDVECGSGTKCSKGPNDVQGVCVDPKAPPGSSAPAPAKPAPGTDGADAGFAPTAPGSGSLPPPPPPPSDGDVHI